MFPELEILRTNQLPDEAVEVAIRFIANPDSPTPPRLTATIYPYMAHCVGAALVEKLPWSGNTRLLLNFFIHLEEGNKSISNPCYEFLIGIIRSLMKENNGIAPSVATEIIEEIKARHTSLDILIKHYLQWASYQDDWALSEERHAENPFKLAAANFIYQTLVASSRIPPEILCDHPELLAALSVHQPEITTIWCRKSVSFEIYDSIQCWKTIVEHSSAYDSLCLEYCSAMLQKAPHAAFSVLHSLNLQRGGCHLNLVLAAAERPNAAQDAQALGLLIEHRNAQVIEIMTRAFGSKDAIDFVSGIEDPPYRQLFELMIERWDQGGEGLLMNFVLCHTAFGLKYSLSDTLQCLGPVQFAALRNAIHLFMSGLKSLEQSEIWQTVSETHPAAFLEDFEELLTGKSKAQRQIAATALAKLRGTSSLATAHALLISKKSEARLGAAALLERIADSTSVTHLRTALDIESADAVRAALHQALKACSITADPTTQSKAMSVDFNLDLFLTQNSKGLKPLSCSWLNVSKLPAPANIDGTEFRENVVSFLIAKQSKHKTIEASPDILPLLVHIDREKSAPFAAALVEGFLNSEQAAADRWALTLGGLLGDNRIITLLLPRISDWCENSRHKLAEYAAQAISLLPGNEPLMVLDTLSNRYRSKFKNVGKACADAFNSAAAARGITTDELGDLVVPDFGFDSEGIRRFNWEGGGASAELGADFKLSWFDPETDKSWKSLPANAPEEIKVEVKTLTKLMREAVKGQTARLELTLVRQRRWASSRWRELFENHPLLRSFASLLVWGVYDASGTLLRTFRRYPNGLLADAAGTLEELAETDTMIGMVHPLEMDETALANWRAHLARFKVKPPFPQIDRPAELMDPLHGNRREIAVTNGKKVSAGTFRSRAEKRGWARGSVIDAGGISSYYKLYPGAEVEVILPTDNFWIGCDPMDTIELASAYFAKAGSVERGSYVYNDPGPDDPRVLRFDQVSAVVFSETLSDLKAIIAIKE